MESCWLSNRIITKSDFWLTLSYGGVTMQRNLFEKNVISVRERFVPDFSALTRSRVLKKPLKKGDQEKLREEIVATYNRLSTGKTIDFLQITDGKGKVLTSLPKDFFGVTSQTTVLRAIKNKKMSGGLIVDFIDDIVYEWVSQPIIGLSGQEVGRLLTAKDITTAYNSQEFSKRLMYGALAAFLMGLVVVFTIYLRRNFRPLSDIVTVLEALNKGDHNVQVNDHPHADEIGAITGAVKQFQITLVKMDDMAVKEKQEQLARTQLAAARDGLTKKFKSGVADVLEMVGGAVEKMENSSVEMSDMAERATVQAETVLGSSRSTAENVQMVASAAEQLSGAITEISQQMRHATGVSGKASDEARMTENIINDLSAVANEIGGVIELINDIAEQTNLLALNATIEAARAGDAGKGFAVVASEVKSLAGQTTKATDDIGAQVQNVQDATAKAVKSIAEITSTISELNEVSTAVGAAVEQQGAATQEIARNIEQALGSTNDVRKNIGDVQSASQRTGELASDVKNSSADVAGMSMKLRQTIETFLIDFDKA